MPMGIIQFDVNYWLFVTSILVVVVVQCSCSVHLIHHSISISSNLHMSLECFELVLFPKLSNWLLITKLNILGQCIVQQIAYIDGIYSINDGLSWSLYMMFHCSFFKWWAKHHLVEYRLKLYKGYIYIALVVLFGLLLYNAHLVHL